MSAMRRLFRLIVIGCAAAAAGCENQHQSVFREQIEAIEREVQLLEFANDYAESFRSGDADAVAALMTEDFVALAPDKEPIEGRDAARDAIAADLQAMTVHALAFVPRELASQGSWAWVWGTSFGSITPEGGAEPIELRGHFLWILRRDGERWLIARDCSHGRTDGETPSGSRALR